MWNTTQNATVRGVIAYPPPVAARRSRFNGRALGAQVWPKPMQGGFRSIGPDSTSPSQRYPDPAVQILDPSLPSTASASSTVEQIGTGMRGPKARCTFGDARRPLVSDIPGTTASCYDE